MHGSSVNDYWLYQWIDENGIRKTEDIHKALRRPHALDHVLELQEGVDPRTCYGGSVSGESLVAGRRVDLSGYQGCRHFDCVSPQIDKLFGKTWHYFDTIVVDDPILIYPSDDASDPEVLYDIEQRVRLLLHLRKIGASEYLAFKRKVSGFCPLHFRKFAEEEHLGLDVLFDDNLRDMVVQELLATGGIDIELGEDGDWRYTIRHPRLELIIGVYSHSDAAKRPSKEEIVRDAFGRYCSGLIADAAAARDLHIPLIQFAETVLFSEAQTAQPIEESIVALNLRLPVLTNVSAKEILHLKNENWPQYERFRSALRVAIKEQIDRTGTKSPEEIANAVVQEYVNPELADIERRLATARKGLARKIGAGVALGGATVTAGAIDSIPLVLATGVAAVATSLPQVYKYFEDKSGVELSDLYFLWKANIKHRD